MRTVCQEAVASSLRASGVVNLNSVLEVNNVLSSAYICK